MGQMISRFLSDERYLVNFLKLTSVALFLGRTWQHLRWDIPIRSLLWDQELIEPIVNRFGFDWQVYAESMLIDRLINGFVFLLGLFYAFCAFAALRANKNRKWTLRTLFAGVVGLLSLACLYFVDKFYRFPELIEFAAQIGAPLLLVASLKYGLRAKRMVYGLKVAIALTFAGHGFYALGFYPRPAGFTTMIMNILPLTEDQSHAMLLRVGFVDMLAALLIFIPGLSRFALMYCVSWGFLTAFARIVAYFSFAAPLASLEQWLHETLFRLPHGALPLVLYAILYYRKKIPNKTGKVPKNEKTHAGAALL
jgi:hypothetical protein